MKNKKTIIILAILIVLIGGIFLVNNIYQNKNKAEVSKTKRKKQNNLAIMIKEDGASDYTKSTSKDIPKGDYTLNYEKSYCKNNGVIGDYDSSLGKVSFSFIGTDSCFLYFDYKESNALYKIIQKRYNEDKTYLGLYTGEDSDTYENNVYYYKDNVQDNNVLFAGFCWKIVRTTETGGVKLIYNGVQTDGSCNNTGTDSQIGTSAFNSSYNSPAYVGYMYNSVYAYSSKTIISSTSFSGTKAYGDGVTYASSKYTLTNATTLSVSSSNISTLVGKYTCNSSSTTGTCTNAWYILGYSGTTIYYYSLSGGTTDGTTLTNKNYVFGASFTYANGTYTLSDTTTINSDTFITNKSNVNTHHYTCLSSGTTCSSLYYVFYITGGSPYYITLTGGKSVDDAINEMLYNDDVNTKDSTIKAYIDNWYKNNMTSYTDKLEDAVFCNDRSMSNKTSNGWYPNGGSTSTHLYFKNQNTSNTSLKCTNENDKFTVDSSNGNGALTYPVGLLTVPEAKLANYGSSNYLNKGQYVWLGSPDIFSTYFAIVRAVDSSGFYFSNVDDSRGVRPVISLKPGTNITSGDGSYTSPFTL